MRADFPRPAAASAAAGDHRQRVAMPELPRALMRTDMQDHHRGAE